MYTLEDILVRASHFCTSVHP